MFCAAVDEPLQLLCRRAAIRLFTWRSESMRELSGAAPQFLLGRSVDPRKELRDRRAEQSFESERHAERRHVPLPLVAGHLISGCRSQQVGKLGLAEPRPFSGRTQIVFEFG